MSASAQAEGIRIEAEFPRVFQPLWRPARYKVFWGGRGKAASWSFARALLIMAAEHPLRILCTRELQRSIKDSVHRLLVDQIELLGLGWAYEVTNTEIRCRVTGAIFIFKGLRYNIGEIKSMEGIDIVWVEEAEKCSDGSWRVLIPTIRKAGSELWITFNPDQPTDPTWKRFCVNPPEGAIVIRCSWRDNPWFPEELRKEMAYDRRVDPEAAAHVWDGEFSIRNTAAVLAGKWRIDVWDGLSDVSGPYHGMDFGFSQDPTVLIKCWVRTRPKRTLYIEREAYKVGCETDDLPELFDKQVPLARNFRIYADSARPETISYLAKRHWKVEPAEKWKGSVEDGVTFLRSFEEIVIHERCRHTIFEAKHYSHKLDKLTSDPLPEIEDKHNNCWDAVRYALFKLIRTSKSTGTPSVRTL